MARALRVEYPGAFYHVINRGNAGNDIFNSLKSHPIKHGNRALLLSFQQLSGIYRPGWYFSV